MFIGKIFLRNVGKSDVSFITENKEIQMSRTIIIGGSAAGATVAARLRRLDEH